MARRIPSTAWQQFLVARKEILDAYDSAIVHAKDQAVAVYHGTVAEADVRNWLATFLPKRYGVVTGQIRSQGVDGHQSATFDVLIYDQLEAPTLWMEASKDKADHARIRIIPAEYVRAVIEVKSAFSRRTVSHALGKLSELEPFASGTNPPDDRYPKYLPDSAVTAILFMELRQEDARDIQALEQIRDFESQRSFYGAVILRAPLPVPYPNAVGLIQQGQSDSAFHAVVSERALLGPSTMTETRETSAGHMLAMMHWSDTHFSQFAFDLLAILNGTFEMGRASSFHGLDFWDFMEPTGE